MRQTYGSLHHLTIIRTNTTARKLQFRRQAFPVFRSEELAGNFDCSRTIKFDCSGKFPRSRGLEFAFKTCEVSPGGAPVSTWSLLNGCPAAHLSSYRRCSIVAACEAASAFGISDTVLRAGLNAQGIAVVLDLRGLSQSCVDGMA